MSLLSLFASGVAFHILLIPVITLLAIIVLLILANWKRAPAAWRTGISGSTLVVILILPWATAMVPKVTIPIFSAIPDAPTESLQRHLPPPGVIVSPPDRIPSGALPEPTILVGLTKTDVAIKSSSDRFKRGFYLQLCVLALLGVWILGVVWGLGVLVLGMLGIIRLGRSSRKVTNGRLTEALRSSCKSLNHRGSVRLLISDQVALPITWGWLRATIALAPDCFDWSAERLDAAFLHELAHIKRRDFAVQTLSRIACIFHWYNPLVLRLFRHWKCDVEQACDDLVLRSGYSGEHYSDILLDVWRGASVPRPQSSLGLAMVRTSTLEERVVAILDREKERGEVSPRKQWQLFALFAGITSIIAVLSFTRPTDYHLTPELRKGMEGILRQVQAQDEAHLALQLGLERQQEDWSMAKGKFEPQWQPTVADVTLELTGMKGRYRANFHPSVSPWINGTAPFYIENKTDVSDGDATWTVRSEHNNNFKWKTGGDNGSLAGFGFRADDQVRVTIGLMEGEWQGSDLNFLLSGPSAFRSTRGIERADLNGKPTLRMQDMFMSGSSVQRRTWWFDPQRDYVLAQYEIEFFNFGSTQATGLTLTTIQEWQKVADEVWYPTHFTTQNLRYANGQLAEGSFRSVTKITSLVKLPSISPATFQVGGGTSPTDDLESSKPTAQEIYDAMIQRYAKCASYTCTGTREERSDGMFGSSDHRAFSLRYERPSKIRVEWTPPSSSWGDSDPSTIYTEGGKIYSNVTRTNKI